MISTAFFIISTMFEGFDFIFVLEPHDWTETLHFFWPYCIWWFFQYFQGFLISQLYDNRHNLLEICLAYFASSKFYKLGVLKITIIQPTFNIPGLFTMRKNHYFRIQILKLKKSIHTCNNFADNLHLSKPIE